MANDWEHLIRMVEKRAARRSQLIGERVAREATPARAWPLPRATATPEGNGGHLDRRPAFDLRPVANPKDAANGIRRSVPRHVHGTGE